MKVITFGSATVDVFLTSEAFSGKKKLSFPFDEKIEVTKELITSGGGGTNVAVGLRRLGFKTGVVARLGQDEFAPLIKEELRREGVETDMLAVVPGETTDYSTILVGENGEKVILVSRGKTRLEEENIPWEKLTADWFHLSSLEGNLKLAKRLLTFAQERGIEVSWNPGIRELVQRETVISLLPLVKILIVNKEEGELLVGKKEFWQKVFRLPVRTMVITEGKKGCWLVFPQQKEKTHYLPFSAQRRETTGAGDAFCSGLIGGFLAGVSPGEAVLWGLANAASVVEHFGAKQGLLTRRGLKKWLKKAH